MAFDISPNGGASGAPSFPASGARDTTRRAAAQPMGHLADAPIALARAARAESVALLNQILADTMTQRDLYKKHHWQASGPTFYELHLLFDKHYTEQEGLADAIAERIQMLGGTAIAMSADVAEATTIARAPRHREDPWSQLARLTDAHEHVLHRVRAAARRAAELGDDGTNDLLVGEAIRTNEKQAWVVWELQRNRREP